MKLVLIFTLVIIFLVFIIDTVGRYTVNYNYEQKIPKIIHQTYFEPDIYHLNKDYQNNIKKLKKMNPEYEYKYYNNYDINEFILENYGEEYLHYYHMIDSRFGAARADFFRYLLMYKVGGVYLDIKSSAKVPFRNIINSDDEYILTDWGEKSFEEVLKTGRGEYCQWVIICVPNHPFLKAVINKCVFNIKNYNINNVLEIYNKIKHLPITYSKSQIDVLYNTGPIMYTLVIKELIKKYNYRIIPKHFNGKLLYTIYISSSTHRKYKNQYLDNNIPLINSNYRNINYDQKIQKNIFQVCYHKNINELPDKLQTNVKILKILNPEYKYYYFNNDDDIENYILNNYGKEYLNLYLSINPSYFAGRVDFFRYLVVNNEGGVYIDMKSSIVEPLREIINKNDEYIITYWFPKNFNINNGFMMVDKLMYNNYNEHLVKTGHGEYCQWFVCGIKNHPFLTNVIKECINRIKNYKNEHIFYVTGPVLYTTVIKNLLNNYNHRLEYNRINHNILYNIYKNVEYKKHTSKPTTNYNTAKGKFILN